MRLDEIESHGEDTYFAAVGSALGEQLGVQIELVGITGAKGKSSSSTREISYRGRNSVNEEFALVINHRWEFDQSRGKPYTRLTVSNAHGESDDISYGRLAFWIDDPAAYASDLNQQDRVGELLDNIFSQE